MLFCSQTYCFPKGYGVNQFFPHFFAGDLLQRPLVEVQLDLIAIPKFLRRFHPVRLVIHKDQLAVLFEIGVDDTLDQHDLLVGKGGIYGVRLDPEHEGLLAEKLRSPRRGCHSGGQAAPQKGKDPCGRKVPRIGLGNAPRRGQLLSPGAKGAFGDGRGLGESSVVKELEQPVDSRAVLRARKGALSGPSPAFFGRRSLRGLPGSFFLAAFDF